MKRSARARRLAAWASLWLAASPGCGDTTAPAASQLRPNVLFLTIDTTRIDALSAYGGRASTPHLDGIAAQGIRYAQAITTAPYTGPSHASYFTGLLPFQHGLRDFLGQALPEEVETLAESLSAAGYQTAAFVSAYVLDPRYGLAQGFDVYRSPSKPSNLLFVDQPSDVTVERAIAWLETRDPEKPFLLWLHLFDAHAPYEPPEAFRTRPDVGGLARASVSHRRQRYFDEVRFMDSQVGRLLDVLRGQGLYDDLVVVVGSDHGENLGEHGRKIATHSTTMFDATLRVPMMIRAPGRLAAGVESAQVSVVDVFPTVLDLLGLEPSGAIAGRSLLDLGPDAADRPAYSETFYEGFPKLASPGDETRTLRWNGWKLVTRPGLTQLFDLAADPDELEDVAGRHPERVVAMLQALESIRAGEPPRVGRALEIDDEAAHVERLRALGYVE